MNKIIYNVTVKIDADVHDDWLKWMQEIHIPDVMNTGLFLENKICRLLTVDDSDGYTYAFQYICPNMEAFEKYQSDHAAALQKDHTEKYKDKFVAFRTMMEIL